MFFNSIPFLLFSLVFFPVWIWSKAKVQLRYLVLTVFSFVFYAWWDWRFLFLIIFSGLIDFFAGLGIKKYPNQKKLYFIVSILINIGSLSVFKYSLFFAGIIETVFQFIGTNVSLKDNIPEFALILPVGISFFTFQSMSYTIDIYRNRLTPTNNILLFFSYLSLFPQLVAGPIVRAKHFIYQLKNPRNVNDIEVWHGFKLIIIGLFQKTVLADNIAHFVNSGFQSVDSFDGGSLHWWLIMVGFSLQIYCDFSGYSLIARGLAKCMGFHFRMNFNHPYLSVSLKDFWSRWHISLSTWFRDYLYIPLGGSRVGKLHSFFNMLLVMVVSGLWHGASLNFIIWGGIHGLFLGVERIYRNKFPNIVNRILCLFCVVIAWVFFRSETFDLSVVIIEKMLSLNLGSINMPGTKSGVLFITIAILFECFYYLEKRYAFFNKVARTLFFQFVLLSILAVAIIFFRGPDQGFIYFQF